MKYLITILFIFCFVTSFSQSISRRGNGSVTVEDSNLFAGNSFKVPVFTDTTAANENRPSLDSAGKLIFTRDVNWFWGRQTSPDRKWVPFDNSSNGLTPTCGSANGTHIVTWDSLLTFDVSGGPYVICCDGIPRATNDVSITLDTNSTDFPRYDLIILDTSGVNWIKGTPAENPATPSTDSCQLILSYVLINAHDSMPANISPPTNPLIIYDENYVGEWIVDSVANITIDTANTIFPAHLVHSIAVSSFTAGNTFTFHTDIPISLNDYGAIKFYIRKTTVAASNITLRWLLNGTQITFPLNSPTANGGTSGYIAYVIPITNFVLARGNADVNELQIQVTTGNAGAFYIDWIQLQAGTFISNISQGGITSVGLNTLDSLLIPSVTNPTVSPVFSFTKYDIPPYRVLVNDSTGNAKYKWGQVDLGTSMVTGLLPVTNLVPGNTGDYLGTDGGIVQWIPLGEDTTFVHNWIRRTVDPNSNNDTLNFGSIDRDSAVLSFNTLLSLNSFTLTVTSGANDNFKLTPDSIYLGTTLSGASTGYVWTLADPTTGSGYWAVTGGGTFPTLQQVFNTEIGGSLLTKTDTILADNNSLRLLGSPSDTLLYVYSTGGGTAISAISEGGELGLFAQGGKGMWGQATDPAGNYGGVFYTIPTSNNTVEGAIQVGRYTTDDSAFAGIGASIDFTNPQEDLSEVISNSLISKLIDVTAGASTSQFKITGYLGGSTVDVLTLNSDGSWQIRPITATAASAITPAEGMMLFVSNTNGTFTSIGMWDYENGAWHKM